MLKSIINSRNFDMTEYWDSARIFTGMTAGVKTETILVPPKSFVHDIIALIVNPVMTDGTCTIKVGDAEDDDLLKEQNANAPANTIWGNDVDEIGDALLVYEGGKYPEADEEHRIKPDWQRYGKWYPNGTTITMTVTVGAGTITRQGDYMAWVKITNLRTGGD